MKMFQVYLRVQDCIVAGYRIVKKLEDLAVEHGDDDELKVRRVQLDIFDLGRELFEQSINIDKLDLAVLNTRELLRVINADSETRLEMLVWNKQQAMATLIDQLRQGYLAISGAQMNAILPQAIQYVREEVDLDLHQAMVVGAVLEYAVDAQRVNRVDASHHRLEASRAALTLERAAETVKTAKEYLATDPKSQLDQIRDRAEEIRESIVQNFSLTDVLRKMEN